MPDQKPKVTLEDVKAHIHRYFVAVYGADYVYRAPETFGNALERWMIAVSIGVLDFAEKQMEYIEQRVAEM